MATNVGVGYSDLPDSYQAGSAAARMALDKGSITRPVLVLLFSTGQHEPAQLLAGVRAIVGTSPRLIGGYGVGIITHDHLSYDGSEVGLAVFESDTLRVDMFWKSASMTGKRQ